MSVARRWALAWADGALCLLVFFPLAVLHWRGTWGLQAVYFFPDNPLFSYATSLAFGSIGSILLQFIHPFVFTDRLHQNRILHETLKRVYLYISGWFVMGFCRGIWELFDYYLSESWKNSVILYVICQKITLVTRTSRNNVGLPFSLALDTDHSTVQPDLLLKSKPSKKLHFLLDIMYGQLVIVPSGILVWRGIWNVLDAVLYPEDQLLSDLVSLVLGYLLCTQLFLFQWPAGVTSAYLDEYPVIYKVLFEDLVMLVACWANLLLWRGGWDLCVHYFIPDPVVGGWVSHWLGTCGLVLLQGFNSVALNGLEEDGSFHKGEGIFNTSYLRIFLAKSCLSPEENSVEYIHLQQNGNLYRNGVDRKSKLVFVSDCSDDECWAGPAAVTQNGKHSSTSTSLHTNQQELTEVHKFKYNKGLEDHTVPLTADHVQK